MAQAPKNSFHFILRFSPGESSWSELAIPSSLVGAFAFELGRSADIPATLNTGSPSFGASSGLPVSQTSWHCCGSQARPALWPQNKASGPFRSRAPGLSEGRQAAAAKGLSEGLAQHRPLPRAVPRAPRARVTSPQAGRWFAAAPASGPALRKLVCSSGS